MYIILRLFVDVSFKCVFGFHWEEGLCLDPSQRKTKHTLSQLVKISCIIIMRSNFIFNKFEIVSNPLAICKAFCTWDVSSLFTLVINFLSFRQKKIKIKGTNFSNLILNLQKIRFNRNRLRWNLL